MEEPNRSWRLTTEAFLGWKQLIEAKQRAWKADEKERYHRLVTLSTKAWQRYVRRWSRARGEAAGGRVSEVSKQ